MATPNAGDTTVCACPPDDMPDWWGKGESMFHQNDFAIIAHGRGVQDLPKNWLYLRTSCGGDPQQGWSNVEVPLPSCEEHCWLKDLPSSRKIENRRSQFLTRLGGTVCFLTIFCQVQAPFTVVNACPCDILCQLDPQKDPTDVWVCPIELPNVSAESFATSQCHYCISIVSWIFNLHWPGSCEVQSTSAEKEDGQGALGDSQALDVYPSLPHCCVVGAGAFASGVGHWACNFFFLQLKHRRWRWFAWFRVLLYIWMFPILVIPQNGWFIMVPSPIKMGWFGGKHPYFWFRTHMMGYSSSSWRPGASIDLVVDNGFGGEVAVLRLVLEPHLWKLGAALKKRWKITLGWPEFRKFC